MNKGKTKIILLIIILGLLIFFFLVQNKTEKKPEGIIIEIKSKQDLLIGGTYLRTKSHPENPFDETKTDTLMILDIKGDYIKFTIMNYSKGTPRFWISSKKDLEDLIRIE